MLWYFINLMVLDNSGD